MVAEAKLYIQQYCIDAEEWENSTEDQQKRCLSVAERTLMSRYPRHKIPPEAVFEFACTLSVMFNDTNKLARQGVNQFALQGVVSYNFSAKSIGNMSMNYAKYIPAIAVQLIGEANGVQMRHSQIGRSVL